MMVKPVKKRAIQEWKMTEAEQPKEKVPDPTPAAVVNHMEKVSRPAMAGILSPTAVMHPTHPFHIPPHGVVIQDPHGAIRNHYVEPMYMRPQGISRRLSPGPPNVMIRPDAQTHPNIMAQEISGLPGRGAKRPQVPQDMAAVEAKSGRKRRKPEGTTELVMSPFMNGSVNGSVHINEKVPPIQPIILDFEVPLPPLSPSNAPEERNHGVGRPESSDRRLGPDPHGAQAMSPAHSPASSREDDQKHAGGSDLKFPSKGGSEGQSQKSSIFKKPDINQYKSSVQTGGGNRCFICQNAIIPNPKDYPVAPSGLVICTKCRKLALIGSPVTTGPPPKLHIPGKGNQSRSQPQQRIPRSPVANSPAASLTLPRSPLPRSPMSRSPAPSSPLPHSSPGSPANTLSAPNSPASTSGLSVPGSPRQSAPSSPRYSAPSSPKNSAPSSPIPRPQGSPLPRNPNTSLAVARSPYLAMGPGSQPPSPRQHEHPSNRRHSISGTHLEVHVGAGMSKASPTGSIGAVPSPRSNSAANSPASLENLQLPPGREGDDATIRALLQLGRIRAAEKDGRSAIPGVDGRILDRADLRLPKSLAEISKLDHAQLLELQHKLLYAGLPSRCAGLLHANFQQNGDIPPSKLSRNQVPHSPGGPPLSKSMLSPNSAHTNNTLKQSYPGNPPQLIRSEGVVGSALPIAALSSTTEDAPLKISRVIRPAQEHEAERRRTHSPNDVQSRLRESLESLGKTGIQTSRSSMDSRSDKNKFFKNGGGNAQSEMYRGQYAVFQCHCSGSEMFFIKCPDCEFICNSIFGMELHIAAQRHAEVRVGPPRDVDCAGCEEQSGKESIADSEGSHSSFETQSADTEGSTGGSPQRAAQEPSSTVYSPVPGSMSERWREHAARSSKAAAGVVDLGSTAHHVQLPRYLQQGMSMGAELRPYGGAGEHPSPLDLSGKKQQQQQHPPPEHHRERSGSRERRSGHEPNSPLDLSGYKHIQTPNSQFVSSQRLGSVGSMIEKSVASTVSPLALTQSGPQMQAGMPPMAVPGMVLPSSHGSMDGQQHPYPIPTMFAVQPSSVAGLYPLSTLAGTVPLLAPVQIQSSSAPPSPSHTRTYEHGPHAARRSSYSLAPPLGRSAKSASPTPLATSSSAVSPQEPSRQIPTSSSHHHQSSAHPSQSAGAKFLPYQGGTITIQPSAPHTTSPHQKTVTLESQFTTRSSPAPSFQAHSPQVPTPSSPTPRLSSTVPPPGVHIKSEPNSDEEHATWRARSKEADSTPEKPREDKQEERAGSAKTPEEKSTGQESDRSPPAKAQTPVSSSPQPPVQIKIEAET